MCSRRSTLVATVLAWAVAVFAAPAATAAVQAGNTGWLWGNPRPQVNALGTLDRAGDSVFAAGDSGTLIVSDDHGDNWRAVPTGVLDPIRQIDAMRPASVVFATRCGLRRTDDGGQTVQILPWRQSQSDCPVAIAGVEFPSLSKGYLLLADGSVLSTEDGGQAWSSRAPLPGTVAAGGVASPAGFAFADQFTGVAIAGGAILRTTDGGASWTEVATGTSATAVDFADGSNGWVAGAAGATWRTQDAGASFDAVMPHPSATAMTLDKLHCTSAIRCVAADTASGAIAIVESGGTRAAGRPPLGTLGDAIQTNGTLLAVGTQGEVLRTGDEGVTWARVSGRLEGVYRGLRAVSRKAAYAFGASGGIAATADGGLTWIDVSLPGRSSVVDVALDTARNGYVATADGQLHRLAGGIAVASRDLGRKPSSLLLVRGGRVLVIGPRGIKLLDAKGRSVAPRGVARRAKLTDCDAAGDAIVAFGRRALLAGNRSGGGWRKLPLPPTKTVKSADFLTASTGYVLDGLGELWFTDTGGRKWRRIDTTGDTAFTSVTFADSQNGYLASASGRILRTFDGGSTWTRQFPFFDARQGSPMLVRATGRNTAIALGIGTNRLLATVTGGQSGGDTSMEIHEARGKSRRAGSVKLAGRVLPAKGGEVVTVLARAKGAKPGAKWVSQTAVAGSDGRFVTLWKISKPTVFVARWSGDAVREGVAASPVVVSPRKRR